MFILSDNYIKIGVESIDYFEKQLENSFASSFPRRYLPSYDIYREQNNIDSLIKWQTSSSGFELINYKQLLDRDEYLIKSPLPEPYVNESPVFFLLQVFARTYVRRNYFVLTDSVAISMGRKTVLLLGYPHSGKSTLTTLSIINNDTPLSTENTVVELTNSGLRVINGTSILIYDPRVEYLYGVKLEYDTVTKHGYRVVDLDKLIPNRKSIIKSKPVVNEIYILHCTFNSGEPGLEAVTGRKIKKTLWYFLSSLLIGVDYYEPHPMYLLDRLILDKLVNTLDIISKTYCDRVYEIYGSHNKAYTYIKEK